MKKSIFNKAIICLVVLLASHVAIGKPRWVKMMDKSHVNYFKAVKRYERYWEKRFEPSEEEEHQRNKENPSKDPRPWMVRLVQSESRAKEKSNELVIEFKKFRKWKLEMLPYVKSDGTLMTPEERLEAWRQLQSF